MKVLLILKNHNIWKAIRKGLAVWFLTCFTGVCIVLIETLLQKHRLPPLAHFLSAKFIGGLTICLLLSLVFTSPALIIATLTLYFIKVFKSSILRLLFSIFSILIACLFVIVLIHYSLGFSSSEIFEVAKAIFFRFTLPAVILFILISHKQLFSKSKI